MSVVLWYGWYGWFGLYGWYGWYGRVVLLKSSHLSLVRSNKDIGCDEESTIFCRRHNIVSFIPDPVLCKVGIVNKLV